MFPEVWHRFRGNTGNRNVSIRSRPHSRPTLLTLLIDFAVCLPLKSHHFKVATVSVLIFMEIISAPTDTIVF